MRQLLFALSAIATVYTVSQTIENMRQSVARKQREDEMMILLRRIDAALAARAA
jgi:hypothetical protein